MENNSSKRFRWYKIFVNKYFIATFLFMAWIIFFDENSFTAHQENRKRLMEMREQKEYYLNRIATDQKKLKDLNGGREELEKFAREQYYMSKPDEDVFIVVEED